MALPVEIATGICVICSVDSNLTWFSFLRLILLSHPLRNFGIGRGMGFWWWKKPKDTQVGSRFRFDVVEQMHQSVTVQISIGAHAWVYWSIC